jgi:hypothetical protein
MSLLRRNITLAIILLVIVLMGSLVVSDLAFAQSPSGKNCTYTGQGYWKNHPDAWPVTSLMMGGQTYSQAQLLDIFDTSPRGDATYILAHQLIAAKLNVAQGADDTVVASTIANADDWLKEHPLGSAPSTSEDRETGVGYSEILDRYNSGKIGPGSCDGSSGDDEVDTDGDGLSDAHWIRMTTTMGLTRRMRMLTRTAMVIRKTPKTRMGMAHQITWMPMTQMARWLTLMVMV